VRSPLYEKRIRFAEKNARNLIRVIRAKNFEGLGHITMADSDNVHEVLKSVGINYLTRESEEVKSAISELNRREMKLVAAYSFSLGPNLHVLTTAERLDMVLEAIGKIGAVKDLMVLSPGNGPELLDEKASLIDAANLAPLMRKQAG
jgi:mevalonate pyrophosphate decarboxylase